MIKVIMSFSAVFDYISGAVGEFAVMLFDKISGALIEACTLEESFTATYSNLLFGAKGIFKSTSTTSNIFGGNDPTTILVAAALALVFGLLVWQLFKSLFGNLLQAEDPAKIIWKGLLYTLIISTYNKWTNAILKLVFSPLYKNFAKLDADSSASKDLFNQLATASKGDVLTDAFGGAFTAVFLAESLIKSIALLILIFPVGIKFIQLSLEVIERFIQMFFVILFGPLCLACGVSPTLAEPSRKWFSVYVNGMINLILNVLGVKLSILAFQNFVTVFAGTGGAKFSSIGEMFITYIAVYAVFKISCEMDNIMNKLGFDTLSAGGLGVALFGGLKAGASTVLGVGGRSKNMFSSKGAMASAAAGGSAAASAAMFFGNKGLVGKAIAGGIAAGTKDGRAALGAAALSSGFVHKSGATGSQFAKEMSVRSDMRQRGNVDGKDLGKVQQMLNDNGIEGTVTKASFDDNGVLHCSMKDSNGESFNISMKHGADYSSTKLPDGQTAASMSFGDDSWGAIVPANMQNNMDQREAQAGGTSADTADRVASNITSVGDVKENNITENSPTEPNPGVTATAAYNSSAESQGYAELAVDSSGGLISCNSKGEVSQGGDHVLSASGEAISKSDLITNSGGQVSTFSNVGSNLVYNRPDGTTGIVAQADVTAKNMPADFQSFSRDPSTGMIRTATAAAIISTGMTPTQVSVPTTGTTMAPSQIVSASGSNFSVASNGYAHSVQMDSRNNVVSSSNQYIEAAPSPSGSGKAMTVPTSDGSCMVQAQRYTDSSCSTPSANGGYVKVGGHGMAISQCAAVNSSGQFAVSTTSPAVTSNVQLYNSSGAAVTTMAEAQSGPVYAKSSDGTRQQVHSGSIESRVMPSASGQVSCVTSGGGSVSITPAPISMRSDGTCKTYSVNSSGDYVENVSGTHIMGTDGEYHEVSKSCITPVAAGTATKYMVGKFETDSKGNIELASSSGSESSSYGGSADVKTVHGQTITAFSSNVELENVQTSGKNCNTIRSANVDGKSYNLRLTDDNSASYWQNADVNQRVLSAALTSTGFTTKSGTPISSDIKAMEIMPSEGHLSCINTDDSKFHFLDSSMYDIKPGTIPSEKTPKVNMNGISYFVVSEHNLKNFKKLDSIIARNFKNLN